MNDIFQIEKQSKGASCAYHTGFLAIDRSEDNARVSQRQRVDAVAKEAYRLYARGLVTLVQRRLDVNVFIYEAVRL